MKKLRALSFKSFSMKRKVLLIGLTLLTAACNKEMPAPSPLAPTVHTIRAGFSGEESGTRSRLEFSESQADVLWTAGDAFAMYKMSSAGYKKATYTTQDDGVTSATFTTSKPLDADDSYTSIYPAAGYSVYRKNDDVLLRIPVPPEQTAVAGGIAEGLNFSAAWSASKDDDLHFYNLLSFVRFRLSGAAVSTLASVTFEAGTTVAGDAALYFLNGDLHFGYTSTFGTTTYERSTSVTLSGSFEEGQDYCIALVPATLSRGFDMVFRDTEGNTIYKHSSKSLTLSRSRIVDFGTIQLGDSWEEDLPEGVVEYVHQTKGRKKNVIAILADGFTESERNLFETLAQNAYDYLFNTEPYKSYKEYFTAYYCFVASNESGAGVIDEDDNVITPVDNYFGSRWPQESYSNMTANQSKIQSYLRNHIPEIIHGIQTYSDVPTALLINDHRYGGICHTYGGGWAYCQIPYQYEGGQMRWGFPKYQAVNERDDSEGYRATTSAELDEMGRNVGDWRNTFLHEFGGHGYGRLTDEYWSTSSKEPGAIAGHSYAVPYALNITGIYDQYPWQADLLDHLDEWVARNPDYARIGIWHGGQTSIYYRWRSEKTSCMIDNRAYFSTWQRMLIVRRIMTKAGEQFNMDDFIAKDVTFDPVRPAANATQEELQRKAARAQMVPEMPMLPPPVIHEDE